MTQVATKIREGAGCDISRIEEQLAAEAGPLVFRGLASEWPLVKKGRISSAEIAGYLLDFYDEAPVTVFVGEPDTGGRIFYTDDLAATNFKQTKLRLDSVLDQIQAHEADSEPPTIYMGSMALDYCLPGLRESNSLPLGDIKASVRIWMGNRSKVAAHYDVLENIACVCAGHRRFTLFPPDQLANLYIGPIDFTPAGQPISLVDLNDPDFDRYPRFAEALEHAQEAELEPGDAIYIPSMWWHHVEGLDSFNLLINHWWRQSPAFMGAPADALMHAIMNIRDLPEDQRRAWKGIFDHYVFDANQQTSAHIPTAKRGALGELDENAARELRTLLRNNLNR